MKIFITGGAGFIGHHLTERLLQQGHSVVAIDNFSTGSKQNIQSFQAHPNYSFHMGNAEDATFMDPFIKESDVTFHMAATVGVMNVVKNSIQTIENNIIATGQILAATAKYEKRLFVFSTSEVYGKSLKIPFCEDDDLVLGCSKKPRWSYAASKLIDEFLANAYFLKHKTRVTTIRLFNTIGQRQVGHYGMVVPRFFKQAMANEPISIYGDGQQTRCFTDVRDVISQLVALIPLEASYGEVLNIGNPDEISILTLAHKIVALCKSTSKFQHVSFDSVYGENFEDMQRRVPNADKLRAITQQAMSYKTDDTLRWIYLDLVEEQKTLRQPTSELSM